MALARVMALASVMVLARVMVLAGVISYGVSWPKGGPKGQKEVEGPQTRRDF